jgi:hypothetical protein
MSFRIFHATVDGSLANPFVVVSMTILAVVSFGIGYRIVRARHDARWHRLLLKCAGLAAFFFISDFLLHFLTNVVYMIYHWDGGMRVTLLGHHPSWLISCAGVAGGMLGLARFRGQPREAT